MGSRVIAITAVLLSLILGGCASGSDFSTKAMKSLRVGLTSKVEADRLLGKPLVQETVSLGNFESILYFYGYTENSFGFYLRQNHKNLHLEFVNDTLNGIVYNNSLKDSSTNFDGALRNQLVPKQITKSQVMNLLGDNSGEVRLPSNLLKRTMPDEYIRSIPDGAKEALVYYHAYTEEVKGGGRYGNHFKVLLIFFDREALMLDKVYVENNPQ